jgi:SSS family solute:Na+ symporter
VGGSAVFFAALTAQALVVLMFLSLNIGYLWYNLIGCAACIAFSLLLQVVLEPRAPTDEGRAA